MPVYVDSGPSLGESLLGGLDAYRTARRQKRQDQQFKDDLARKFAIQNAELGQQGIHLLGKNDVLPFDVSQGLARQDSDAAKRSLPQTAAGLGGSFVDPTLAPRAPIPTTGTPPIMPPVASPIPSRAAAGRQNIPGQGSFIERMTAMLSGPSRGPRYERGNGYYIDHKPQWDQQDAALAGKQGAQLFELEMQRMLAEQERGRKAGVYAGAGVDPSRAALYAENPALAGNDPLFMRPTPVLPRNIDPLSAEGIAAAARRAAAIAAAEAPYRRDPNASPPPRPVQPTEFSNKAALVYPRAEQAAKILDEFFTNGAPAESVLGHVPVVGNYLQSDASQRMNQAAETVASAILRLESGAAITQDEIKRYARQFLPEPGDGADVRAQKRATLMTQLQRLRAAAGPSMGQPGVVPVPTGDTTANPWRTP